MNCRLQLARIETRNVIYKRSFDTTRIAISDDVALIEIAIHDTRSDIVTVGEASGCWNLLHANDACAARATAAVPSSDCSCTKA